MKLCARFEVSFSFRDMFEELPESPERWSHLAVPLFRKII